MVYTEVRKEGKRKKYYRVFTYRENDKIVHKQKYLGTDIGAAILKKKEKEADVLFVHPLNVLLNAEDKKTLERIKKIHQTKNTITFENRYEAFISEFTYDSTGIEGNTLTLQETSALLFEGATPHSKLLREVYEVLNHKKAFDHLLQYQGDITKQLMCTLQKIITKNTLKQELIDQAGIYRTVPVFIRGAKVIPPKPEHLSHEMRSLVMWYSKNKKIIHPIVLSAYFHTAFEAIHPFVDGNGRVGRLLLNLILHKNGYPMISIPRSQRLSYFESLAKAQSGNLKPFLHFVIRLLKKTEKSI